MGTEVSMDFFETMNVHQSIQYLLQNSVCILRNLFLFPNCCPTYDILEFVADQVTCEADIAQLHINEMDDAIRVELSVFKDLDDIWVFILAELLEGANFIINVVFGDASKGTDHFPREDLQLACPNY